MDFENLNKKSTNRPKIIFWIFCRISEEEKWTLENLMKIEKIAQKSFFRTFCRISEGEKWTLENFDEKWKNHQKIIFFGLTAGFLKGKIDFDDNWKDRPKIIFSDFLQDFWNEKVDFKQCSGKWIISLKDRWVAIFLKDGKVKYIWKISNMLK